MPVSARMYVESVFQRGFPGHYGREAVGATQEEVVLQAVYSDDPDDPNFTYSEATPQGEMKLMITNKDAFGFFVPGETYNIEIRRHVPARSQKKDE